MADAAGGTVVLLFVETAGDAWWALWSTQTVARSPWRRSEGSLPRGGGRLVGKAEVVSDIEESQARCSARRGTYLLAVPSMTVGDWRIQAGEAVEIRVGRQKSRLGARKKFVTGRVSGNW